MQFMLSLPSREEQLMLNRRRWAEVLSDCIYADHPHRIETNAYGQVIMTPAAAGGHSTRASEIAYQLRTRLGGKGLTECPVSTIEGVKALDVGWYSDDRHNQVRGQKVYEIAAEICVEVLSPSNTPEEMQTKRRLYFDAGAIECWICDLEGKMRYYESTDPETANQSSTLCPDFPDFISD